MSKKLHGGWACLFLIAGRLHAATVFTAADPGSTPGDFSYTSLTVNSNSAMVNASFDIRNMFGGEFVIDQSIFFDDPGTSHVYEVNFTTDNPIDLIGYDLYLGNDGGDVYRALTRFEFLLGSTVLSDVTISPDYNNSYGSHIIRLNDTFALVSGTEFTARFHGGDSEYNGVRVMEFDAITATPEPSSLALGGLGAFGLWLLHRRRDRLADRS